MPTFRVYYVATDSGWRLCQPDQFRAAIEHHGFAPEPIMQHMECCEAIKTDLGTFRCEDIEAEDEADFQRKLRGA